LLAVRILYPIRRILLDEVVLYAEGILYGEAVLRAEGACVAKPLACLRHLNTEAA
jgi:hypothetical protein